jgi:GR25 family glycosyltransferase involved in LPS biosynthesis
MKNNYILLIIIILIIILLYILLKKEIKENFVINKDAYIINLEKRPDRLEKVISKFKDLDLELYRTPAIFNETGWKGCGSSHVSVVKMAKEKKLPYILIMEDDCKPRENFKEIWPLIQEWLENNSEKWDMYAGGNRYYSYHPDEISSIKPICSIDNTIKLFYTKFVSAQFYYLNSSAYDTIIEWEEHMNKNNSWIPIDLWPDFKKMRVISSVPFITLQEKDYSNIEKTERDYTDGFYRNEEVLNTIENNIQC